MIASLIEKGLSLGIKENLYLWQDDDDHLDGVAVGVHKRDLLYTEIINVKEVSHTLARS
jgi:hypothetical protein